MWKNIFDMKQKYVIGIDVSKSKLDCAVVSSDFQLHLETVIFNNEKRITSYLKEMLKVLKIASADLLVCCENTGIYNRPLEKVCIMLGIGLWVEHAVKIKRASTDMRGKSDRRDALRIAQYAIRYNDKMTLYHEPLDKIKEMHILIRCREKLISQKGAIKNHLKEAKTHDTFEYEILMCSYKKMLKTLESSILEIEQKIELLTHADEEINRNKELLTSIPGIGSICAINLIVVTNNFQSFNNAKHLGCYAGVVPFKNESGTIIKKERISNMANQKIKKLLHMSAMASIRSDKELKTYFLRKVSEGKNKMSVLNAVRNKLVHRIMAVINRKQPFLQREEFISIKNSNSSCLLT